MFSILTLFFLWAVGLLCGMKLLLGVSVQCLADG